MITIDLSIDRRIALTSNDRLHWAAKSRRTKTIRHLARLAARGSQPIPGPVDLTVELGFPDKRRRDLHNLQPTVKAAVDGCVDAGLIADDHAGVIASETYLLSGMPSGAGRVNVRLIFSERTGK